MPIYMGNTKIGQLSMGSTAIKEAYIGSTCIYKGDDASPTSVSTQNKE